MAKLRAITVLALAEIAALALWFSSSAVLAEMGAEAGLAEADLAGLTTAVQLGFAGGALGFAVLGFADRFDPRIVFLLSALVAAGANLALLVVPIGGAEAIALRALTGVALAGVYPVGMKIAVGWGTRDRALLVGILVGALTIGSAAPHLVAWIGAGTDWRETVAACSVIAALGGASVLAVGLGPHHARAQKFDPTAISLAWKVPRLRLAIIGYIGHVWELYAFWAWVGVVARLSFERAGSPDPSASQIIAFVAIAAGGLACVPSGWLADRWGRAPVALACLMLSGGAGLASALAFGGEPWLMAALLILWGVAIVPDSALYSTMVADAAPAERAGSLMTFQNALGFLVTALTVQALPAVAAAGSWPVALALLAVGPALGIWAMAAFMRLDRM
ncbi:MAG: MFS transporter [Pseudomonadota bacterium]